MDFYLQAGNSYQRLEDEFKKYGKLIFCVDFDDTIFDFHKKGRTYDDLIQLLKRWEPYSEVIIFTGNGVEKNPMIEEYMDKIGVRYKGINCDASISFPGRKIYANVYIDANTCNLSEDWVGYATRYGDGAGDFSPLSQLTVAEVKAIGRELGLPEELVNKVPTDGLCGKTDEDNLGFTYDELDLYIRTGKIENQEHKAKIDHLHQKNLFKLKPMPHYEP